MPSRHISEEPSNALDAICLIAAERFAKRAGLKVARSKSTAHAERRARRKHTLGAAPYPAPSLSSVASKHYGPLRRDSPTPPPLSDASSVASSASPRTPPMGYIAEPFIASRQSSVDCDPHFPRLREHGIKLAKGKAGLFSIPFDQLVPLRTELDVIPSTRLGLYDGTDSKIYGKMALFAEDMTYDSASMASDEQVDEVFGMFLNDGYYGDTVDATN